MRNTSEPKRAPSWTARISVTKPDSRDDLAVGHRAVGHHDVVELQPLPRRHADAEHHRRGVLAAEDPADGHWFHVGGRYRGGARRFGDSEQWDGARRGARRERPPRSTVDGSARDNCTAGTDGPRPAASPPGCSWSPPWSTWVRPSPRRSASASRRWPCGAATPWPCTRRPRPSPPSPASLSLQLARGVRRGQRWAWAAAVVLLGLAAGGPHPQGPRRRGGGPQRRRRSSSSSSPGATSSAPTDRESVRRGAGTLLARPASSPSSSARSACSSRATAWPGASAGAVVSERLVGAVHHHHRGPSRHHAHHRAGRRRHRAGACRSAGCSCGPPSPPIAVRDLDSTRPATSLDHHGGDTLSYFALRDDKHHLRIGDTLVAYAVRNGVCLVSPDPIGPEDERADGVVGLPRPRHPPGLERGRAGAPARRGCPSTGQRHVAPLHRRRGRRRHRGVLADGGAMKGLRQAVNRIANHGYTIAFHDPAAGRPGLADQLRALDAREPARPGRAGLLDDALAAASTPATPACCSPSASTPTAYRPRSASTCRRPTSTATRSTSCAAARASTRTASPTSSSCAPSSTSGPPGHRGLSLNFAAMRAVLAGEMGDTMGRRMEKRVMERLSGTMQIESLWRYNAKFQPAWRRALPRLRLAREPGGRRPRRRQRRAVLGAARSSVASCRRRR